MSNPELNFCKDLDVHERYACFHPAGEVSLIEAVRHIKDAISFSREKGISRLLVDATQLKGIPIPSVADRYWIARDFAAAAGYTLVVAFALQQYLLDPERFGVTVATNLGMRTQAFSSSAEALVWLLEQPNPTQNE